MASVKKRSERGGKWPTRYRDDSGRQHSKHFDRKVDAEAWLVAEQSAILRDEWVDPCAPTFRETPLRSIRPSDTHLMPAS